jgi:CheY-like chemotaxis protein
MPVLDGFGLTRQVREREAAGAGRLPVVAVTANALDGEGDRCIEAGMDAYLTKPVDLTRLAGVLSDLLPEEPVRPDDPVDLGVLRTIVGDDERAVAEVLGTFADTVRQQEDALMAAHAAADASAMTSAAHRIAGAAASVGATRLVALARAVELGTGGLDGTLAGSVRWLRDEVGVVNRAVDALRNGHG